MNREWVWRIVMLVGSLLISYFSATAAVNDRVTRIDTRTEAQFQEILRRFDEEHNTDGDFRSEIRGELRTLRDQMLQMAKEQRKDH